MEPPIAARLNPGHRLARDLVGCWLFNEGAGRRVHDVSGHFRDGSFSGGPLWVPARWGHAVTFDGYDDWISMGDCLDLGTDDISLLCLVSFSAANQPEQWSGNYLAGICGKGYLGSDNKGYGLYVGNNQIAWQVRNQSVSRTVQSDNTGNDGLYHVVVGICDRDSTTGMRLYIDGIQQADAQDPTCFEGIDLSGSQSFAVGSRHDQAGSWAWDFLGTVAAVHVWKRVLTNSEIIELHRDPFAFCEGGRSFICGHTQTGGAVDLAGTVSGQSACTGTLRRTRNIAGAIHASSAVGGSLDVTTTSSPEPSISRTEAPWRREAVFHGATAAGFHLGTVLTQGWFWVRQQGCQVVQRGPNLSAIDFGNILRVLDVITTQFSLPNWVSHAPDATYCYVVQRFNGCGVREKTMGAAAVVHVGPDGHLTDPVPNPVFGLKVEPTRERTLRIAWLYTPIDQAAPPERFYVYLDGGSGQIDLQNLVAVLEYQGRRFYCHECGPLAEGTYRFLVRAQGAAGAESLSSPWMARQVKPSTVPTPLLLSAEAI